MLWITVIASIIAAACAQDSVSGSYTGRYSYYIPQNYGSFSGLGSAIVTTSGVSVSTRWSGSGIATASGFYGWGSASVLASGTTAYWGVCVSGYYSPSISGSTVSYSGTGNVGFSSFQVSGTGSGQVNANSAWGTISGAPTDISVMSGSSSSSSSSGFSFPTICGSLTTSANSGWRNSGSFYLGTAANLGTVNFYASTVSGVTRVYGSGTYMYNAVRSYIYLADFSHSSGMFSAQGVAGGRPFSATGSYILASNSAIQYNYWRTDSVYVTSNAVDAYGTYPSTASYTAVGISGYVKDHGAVTTSSGLYVSGSMLNGNFEVSISAGGTYTDYITGTYSSSGSSSSSGSGTSGYWSASGNWHGLSIMANGIYGNGGYWVANSVTAYCSIYNSVSCSSMQCTMPSLGSTSGGVLSACGSMDSISGSDSFSGSGYYQGYSFSIENGQFLMSGKIKATLKMAMLEMNLSGSSYAGGSFMLSGSGPGTYYFSATGVRFGSAWTIVSGYMRS